MSQFMASQDPFQSLNRVSRSAHFNMDELAEKMKSMIGNITCVLKEMNLMDENHQPIYDTSIQHIQELQVADELKADLLYAMEMGNEGYVDEEMMYEIKEFEQLV